MARNAKGAARRPPFGESGSGRRRPGRDSEPAQTGLWAGAPCVVRYRRGGRGHEAQCYHLSPAASERTIVARSDRATVKRFRFAFTAPPQKICIPALDSGERGGPSRSGRRSSPNDGGPGPGGTGDRSTGRPARLGQCSEAPPFEPPAIGAASAGRVGPRGHQAMTPSPRSGVRAAWPRDRRVRGATTGFVAERSNRASRSAAAAGRPNR
jgi:hypothetical protein